MLDALDLGSARRCRLEQKRVNVDIPVWMIDQSIIKVWLAERLDQRTSAGSRNSDSSPEG